MAKVRCKVCANEVSGTCKIKKIGVRGNKSRNCDAFVFDEAKTKARDEVPVVRIGYRQQQENKKRLKAEIKRIKEELKKGPSQGTARDLGLLPQESSIIMPGDARFSMPSGDLKHPLTGDLSRFMTTASDKE